MKTERRNGAVCSAWRAAAHEAYRKLQTEQRSANQPTLGEIRFTGEGWKKALSSSAQIPKLQAISKLKDIIDSAKFGPPEPLNKPRKDGIVKFYWCRTASPAATPS
jgi:hypothetical protein